LRSLVIALKTFPSLTGPKLVFNRSRIPDETTVLDSSSSDPILNSPFIPQIMAKGWNYSLFS